VIEAKPSGDVGRAGPRAVCAACGGPLSRWITVESLEPGLPGGYELDRCARCGSAFTREPASASLYERGAYDPTPPRAGGLVRGVMGLLLRERVRILRRVARPGRAEVLDVGAGRGGFVASALRAGFRATGIEPSEQGATTATSRGAPVTRASIEDAEIARASIDVLTMWHVLEHLEDPAAALALVAGWLKPGGVAVIAVPNLDSLQARIGGPRWFHLDVPRHRSHLTPAGLDALLAQAGLERTGTRHVLIDNFFGMWQTWCNLLTRTPSYLYNLLRRNAPLASPDLTLTLLAVPLVPIAVLVELAAGVARHGGTMVVIARPSGVNSEEPLDDFIRRGLVTPQTKRRRARRARVKPEGSVSDLVPDQRR
jgi:SAM-dependent methyltransferase